MTVVVKRLWLKRKNLVLFAWLLRNMSKEICDWKMCLLFWRSPALPLEPERESPKPKRKAQNEPQPFCGLISCASCGMMITAENKTKRQKNGNVHHYVYYRCTKK